MENDYQSLKEKSGKSWSELHAETGIPITTIRNYVAGKVADPKPEILCAIEDAIGMPEMAYLRQDVPSEQPDDRHTSAEGTRHVLEMMGKTRDEMLEMSAKLYEQQIAQLERALLKSERRTKRLAIALAVCVIFFTLLMAFDILKRNVGWFRGSFFLVFGGALP